MSDPGKQNAIKELKQEGSQLWREVKQLHISASKEKEPRPPNPENPQNDIDRAFEKRLLTEIDSVSNEELKELSTNPDVLYELLKDDLTKSVRQLEETLIFTRSEISQTDEAISREKDYCNQHEMLGNALSKKLEEELSNVKEESQASILNQYNRRQQKLETHLRQVMKKMARFVNEYFPVPDDHDETVSKSRKRHSSGPSARDTTRTEPYLPMLKMLEVLLNRCIDSPFDPYMDITDEYWPPYIELLLRYNLVTRHPEIESKIKLVPFHL